MLSDQIKQMREQKCQNSAVLELYSHRNAKPIIADVITEWLYSYALIKKWRSVTVTGMMINVERPDKTSVPTKM